MAELLGPDATSRTVDLGGGKSAHGRTATVYSNTAGTTLAAILTYDGTETPGAAITGSQVTVGADSKLPQFWFPNTYDTLYYRVTGMSGVKTIYADVDRRLDAVPMAQAAAVADVAALTSAAITGGESPTEAEHNAVRVDAVATRTTVNALLASLRAAGVIDT